MVIGRVLSIDELMDDYGFESVFIGSGAGLPRFMNIPGENLCGVYSANEFLTRTNLMKAYKDDSTTPIMHAKKVAVVGGGNVAMDAARCAKRLGAEEVYIVYRRSEEELPARKEEVEHAKEEGIIFKLLNNPVEILGNEDEFVTGMKCIKMELGEPDASGRRRLLKSPAVSSFLMLTLLLFQSVHHLTRLSRLQQRVLTLRSGAVSSLTKTVLHPVKAYMQAVTL